MSLIQRADYPVRLHPPLQHTVNAWLDRAHTRVSALLATWQARRTHTQEMATLARFDTRELHDLGLSHTDLIALKSGTWRRD